jgi:hypothetical protein
MGARLQRAEVTAMKGIRNAFAAGVVVAVASVVACSGELRSIEDAGSHGADGSFMPALLSPQVGQVGMNVNVFGATGTSLGSITYACTNGTSSFTGRVDIGDAQSIHWVVGGVPAGSGYTCTLTTSDSSGDACSGMVATFSVMAGELTRVMANVTCAVPPTDAASFPDVTTGPLEIDAGVIVGQEGPGCPGIESFSISPPEVLPPQTAALASTSTTGGGGTKTLQWSTDCVGAVILNPTSENATFSCGAILGAACHVTLDVGLIGTAPDGGSLGQVCAGQPFTSLTSTIVCEGCLLECPPGHSVCGLDGSTCSGICVNLNGTPVDPNNCGQCGVTCSAGMSCVHDTLGNLNACMPGP